MKRHRQLTGAERAHRLAVLKKHDWRVYAAARELGMPYPEALLRWANRNVPNRKRWPKGRPTA